MARPMPELENLQQGRGRVVPSLHRLDRLTEPAMRIWPMNPASTNLDPLVTDARAVKQNAEEHRHGVDEDQSTLGDGDLVAAPAHTHLEAGEPELATVHIFRFEKGRIAELCGLWPLSRTIRPT